MNNILYRPMGKAAFVPWTELDHCFNLWAKSYFGPHVSAEAERDETDCYLSLSGLKPEDYKKFECLFAAYDKDGDCDAAEEFGAEPIITATLPDCVTRGTMAKLAASLGLQQWGCSMATYSGVFVMEGINTEDETAFLRTTNLEG